MFLLITRMRVRSAVDRGIHNPEVKGPTPLPAIPFLPPYKSPPIAQRVGSGAFLSHSAEMRLDRVLRGFPLSFPRGLSLSSIFIDAYIGRPSRIPRINGDSLSLRFHRVWRLLLAAHAPLGNRVGGASRRPHNATTQLPSATPTRYPTTLRRKTSKWRIREILFQHAHNTTSPKVGQGSPTRTPTLH